MRHRHYICLAALCLLFAAAGCGNPIKRPPSNVFPGSDDYTKRVENLKIKPEEAYSIALEQARTDGRLQFLSKRPTVIVKRTYVFSRPQPSGANLQGYHVNGDTGAVKFVNEKKTVAHSKR